MHYRLTAWLGSMVLVLLATFAHAGGTAPGQVFMVGHSLVNFDMPTMLKALADDAGIAHTRGEQITIGAPLGWNWTHSATAQGLDARVQLPTGDWNVLVLTEAVPLDNHLQWSDTYIHAGNFHQLALDGNPATRTFIYETWHCIGSGTPAGCEWDANGHIPWRQRLDDDLPKWQGIADHLNTHHNGPDVRLVPAGQALALLHDRIFDGAVPGYGHVFDLFSDDIHLTHAGNYFVALVMFASIYERSPEGLTHAISNQWGTPYDLPDAETAAAMQAIAWQAVRGASEMIFADGFDGEG